MANQPLELFIKKGVGGSDTLNDSPTNQEIKPEETKGETNNTSKIVAAQVVNFAKQGMMTAVRNYGDVTGRAREQKGIENVISVASVGATFIMTGPVIGSIVLMGASVLSASQSAITQFIDRRQVEFNNQRLGGIIKDGNR